MGWNSWNAYHATVTGENVMHAARAMVSSGLINHGWSYINIDDSWQGKRGGKFNGIQPNEKFPDMQKMCDDIHGMGFEGRHLFDALGDFLRRLYRWQRR